MSLDEANYTFVPWVREGYRPTEDDAAGSVAVTLAVDADGDERLDDPARIETTLSLYGPGEVTGVDRRQVVRTDPVGGTTDFPPNYFPTVEFDRPDLPWLFSPEADDAQGRVTPWLTLVTVADGEGVTLTTDTETPASTLTIGGPADPGTELPDLSEAWAWAHAQTVGTEDTTGELRRDGSVKTLSRLVSPRKLDPNTEYLACVVPVYEAGRLAGLGSDPGEASNATSFAWDSNAPGRVRLPVYYHWSFSTGGAGDFESLTRRLSPATLTDVGVRRVDAGDPGPDVLRQDGETVTVEGALRSTDLSPDPYDPTLQDTLADLLDEASGLTAGSGESAGVPVLGPPTYGQWPPATPEVPGPGERPLWLRDLNVDPRFRVPAGYGTRVVQENQEHLVHAAWEQVGDIRRANSLLGRARLARAASQPLYDDLAGLDDATRLLLTEPLHGRTSDGNETVSARVADSAVSSSLLSPALRRITRANGPLARRFGGLSTASLVRDVAAGRVDPGPDDAPPDGIQTVGEELQDTLCATARRRQDDLNTWHPLGDEATRRPATVLERVREACRRFRRLAAEFRRSVQSTPVEPHVDPFVEPVMGVCSVGDESFQTDLDDLAAALESEDWEGVHDTLSRTLRAVAQSARGHETLVSMADSDPQLARALADDPGLTPAFEAFRDRLYRLTLLVFGDVFWVVCRQARGYRKTLRSGAEVDTAALDRLAATCVAICGDGQRPGGLLARVSKQLRAGDARSLRESDRALHQLLALAADQVESLRESHDGYSVALADLETVCRAADRYAAVVRAVLADAPWDLAADAVGGAACSPPVTSAEPLDVSATANAVFGAIEPSETIMTRLADRLGGVDLGSRPDPLARILAHPEFTQPMYEPLREYAQESLVPGVGEIPGNTVGVLETNPAFVESYLLGLSHEFARELRWREFPTDMRGTFFRQFWDPAGREWERDEAKRDIDYVHRWNDSLGLGGNAAAKMAAKTTGGSGSVGGHLVLLVRGEVFDRYPNTDVYAARGRTPTAAELDDDRPDDPGRVPDLPEPTGGSGDDTTASAGEVREPVFRGRLNPDITFFGFELTESEAVADPGWFFVLEEPPTEPTFGLDVPVDDPDDTGAWGWEDLTWDDVDVDGYVSATTLPDGDGVPETLPTAPAWGKNSAHTAAITWQRPYRVAIHADDMIPHGGSP